MKFIFVGIFVLFVSVSADEIQRIESIVNDIAKLRLDYDKTQEELSLSLVKLKDEQDKNDILLRELKKVEKEVQNLKNQIKNIKSNDLSNSEKKVIIKEKSEKCIENQIVKKNEFPQLQMKEKALNANKVDVRAHTYRLRNSANIYDAKGGNVVHVWDERTSFTSSFKSGTWIKVTGYFVDKIWKKSDKELWIKEADTKSRGTN